MIKEFRNLIILENVSLQLINENKRFTLKVFKCLYYILNHAEEALAVNRECSSNMNMLITSSETIKDMNSYN